MIFDTYIHPANPIKFIPTGYAPTDRYNTVPMDRDWFADRILSWQQKVDYAQPVQLKDRLSLQFWASPGTTITLYLYKCDGTLIENTEDFTLITTPSEIDFNGSIYNAYKFIDNDYWSLLDEGRYYLYAWFQASDPDNDKYYISEPIELKEKHEGSVLLAYGRPDNISGLISEQTRQRFEKRIFGAFMPTEHGVERVSFLDNGYNTTQLHAVSYRKKVFMIGGDGGQFPDYELDCLMHVYDFPMVKHDNVPHVAAEGAALILGTHDRFPLYTASIELRESDNEAAYTNRTGTLRLATFTYPVVVMYSEVGIENGIMDFFYLPADYLEDDTAAAAYASDLNAEAINQGLTGTFSMDGDELIYTLGDNETYNYAYSKVLTKFMTVTHTPTGSGQGLNFITRLTGANTGVSSFAKIDPDLSVEVAASIGATEYVHISNWNSPSAGSFTSYIFHDDTMASIGISGDYLTNTGGDTPVLMTTFGLFNSPIITSYNMYQALEQSKYSLQTIVIKDNITLNGLAQYYYSPSAGVYVNLNAAKYFDFRGNNMTNTKLNELYNNYAGITNSAHSHGLITVFGGIINTSGQLTGHTPTGASTTSRSILVNTYNWIVII
jgi:hypothetical protein